MWTNFTYTACRFFSLGSLTEELFVKTGYRDWKHATGRTGVLMKHNNSLKHKQAMASWSDFKVNQRKHTSAASSLENRSNEQISHNRHYLKTIIELLLFCASQEIGSGSRDDPSTSEELKTQLYFSVRDKFLVWASLW